MRRSFWILLAGTAFGSSVVMTRFAVTEIPPIDLVAVRLATAAALFVPTLLILRLRLPGQPRVWADLAVVGATTAGPLVAFTFALQWISAGVLSVFLAFIPLFTAILAHRLVAGERLNRAKAAGLIIAFAGVLAILLTRTSGLGEIPSAGVTRGHLLALLGTVSSAYAGVHTRLHLRQIPSPVVTAGQLVTGFLFVLPLSLALGSFDPGLVEWRAWLAALYTGIVGSFLAFWAVVILAQRFGATASALPAYLLPLVSSALGAALLGEQITLAMMGGGALILLGLYLANR